MRRRLLDDLVARSHRTTLHRGKAVRIGKSLSMVKREPLAIIIASKNRFDDVRRALLSIRTQTVMPDEVIVIDQSSQPYALADFPYVKHVYDPSITSLTAARNRAIDAVSSPRVLFIDDDVELLPNLVSALHVAFDSYPDAVGFQCKDLERQDGGRMYALLEAVFAFGFFARRMRRRNGVVELSTLEGFGMAYRSSVFNIERFDEDLVGYSFGEDWDFSKRVSRLGRLIAAEDAQLHHYRSPVNRNGARAICRMRWANYMYFYEKNVVQPSVADELQKQWWKVGETYRWLREGLGFPSTRKARKP